MHALQPFSTRSHLNRGIAFGNPVLKSSPPRTRIQPTPRQLPLARQTGILAESGFGGWVNEKIKLARFAPRGRTGSYNRSLKRARTNRYLPLADTT